ncbi:MAG: hypothetical protein Q9Q40_14480 [Acidobacteriota bacterium]|nr:hypothetical protein [Acidobacteriota bacterium]
MQVSGVMIVGILVGILMFAYSVLRYRREMVEYVRGDPSRSLWDLAPCFAWGAMGVGIALFSSVAGDSSFSWKEKVLVPLGAMLAIAIGGPLSMAIDRYLFAGPLYRRQVAKLEKRRRKLAEDSEGVEEKEREE